MESKDNINEYKYKRETDSDTENILMVTKGEREGRKDKLRVWD